jgi:cobalt/nickel transport system permease protein
LVRREVALCPCGCIGRRRKANFVEKTLTGAAELLRTTLSSDETSARAGLLQRVDPRVKLVSVVALLVVAALVHHAVMLFGLYALTLALAVASRIPLRRFAGRVWLFVPLFTGIVVLPATLNIVTPGRVVVPFGHWWFGHEIGLTSQGLSSALLIVTRVGVSISLVMLLTLTTSWPRLLIAMRSLFVPRLFVAVLAMAHRYLYQLMAAVTDMFTARKARAAGARDVRGGRAFVSASAGALLGKAHVLSEEVYQAMVARGYRGEGVALAAPRVSSVDWMWAVSCLCTAFLVLGGDHVLAH